MLVDTASDGLAQQFLKGHEEVKMKNRKVEGSSPETMMTQGVVREENRKGEKETDAR